VKPHAPGLPVSAQNEYINWRLLSLDESPFFLLALPYPFQLLIPLLPSLTRPSCCPFQALSSSPSLAYSLPMLFPLSPTKSNGWTVANMSPAPPRGSLPLASICQTFLQRCTAARLRCLWTMRSQSVPATTSLLVWPCTGPQIPKVSYSSNSYLFPQ
jgi:hypothetical protein